MFKKLKVHYINVGQGDSTFIELPNGESMLIDAGNPGDDDIIKDVINNAGYSKIDYVIATHPHSDHIGSMADIIEYYTIGKMYMPGITHTTKDFENILDMIEEKRLNTVQKVQSAVMKYSDINYSLAAKYAILLVQKKISFLPPRVGARGLKILNLFYNLKKTLTNPHC